MNFLRESIVQVFGKDYQVEIRKSTIKNSFRLLVENAIENKSDYVILAGGDGSVNEGVNGYFAAESSSKEKVVLGVLPAGSGNDFAKSLKVENDLPQLLRLIQTNSFKKIDVGLIKFMGVNATLDKRYFINISDIGIGGFVAKKISNSKKRFGGDFTYTKAVIQSFFQYKKQSVQLKSANCNWSGKMLSICMANGKYFGSGMCIAPDASLTDGEMQLVVIGDVKLTDYLKNLPKIKRGQKIQHNEVTYSFAKECEITSEEVCPIDMDGEYIGTTPLNVKILKQEIQMLMKF